MRPDQDKPDTGRNAWREPDEPFDGRPLVICRRPFWRDMTEQLTYQIATETHRYKWPEPPGAYIQRIAEIVAGKLEPAAKSFPEARLPYRDPDDEREAILADTETK